MKPKKKLFLCSTWTLRNIFQKKTLARIGVTFYVDRLTGIYFPPQKWRYDAIYRQKNPVNVFIFR